MALSAGRRLGPYEILAPLGAGGMGEVYRARDPKLNRDVAIKILPETLATDPVALARFCATLAAARNEICGVRFIGGACPIFLPGDTDPSSQHAAGRYP